MNKEVANKYFPLYRAEVYERPKGEVDFIDDESKVVTVLEISKKEHVDDDWQLALTGEFEDMMVALSYAGVSFHRLKKELPLEPLSFTAPAPEYKLNFPLRKITIEEYVYGRDTGSPWSDPENDIRHSVKGVFWIQRSLNGDWEEDYLDGYGSFDYAVHGAMKTQADLLWNIPYQFMPYNEGRYEGKIVMFEAYAHLFKFKYHFPEQKAICGETLTGYYNEYEGDGSIKVDYLHTHVFLHEEGKVITFRCCLWLNGENIISFKELEEKHNISTSDVEWGNENFKEWLKANHPEAKCVSTLMSWYSV